MKKPGDAANAMMKAAEMMAVMGEMEVMGGPVVAVRIRRTILKRESFT